MSDLLLEIGCEELPSLYIDPALKFIKRKIVEFLNNESLNYGLVRVEGTPRRLFLLVSELDTNSADKNYEIIGPKINIAYDSLGKINKIGLNFLNAKKINEKNIYKKNTEKGDVIAAKIYEKGKKTKKILSNILTKILIDIPFKKKMKWESSKTLFARPVRWILCLFNEEIIKIKFADIESSDKTYGHKFSNSKCKKIKTTSNYFEYLKKNNIMLSIKDRMNLISYEAEKLSKKYNGKLIANLSLIKNVANTVEYPCVLIGCFEKKFLQIPKEILISEMIDHQKCFAIENYNGDLLPYFIIIAGFKSEFEKEIINGNARVLCARFDDAEFYYKQDLKFNLHNFSTRLNEVSFHRYLGSVKDKIQRMKKLAFFLCAQIGFNIKINKNIDRAIHLCKADLTTGVVSEFPSLQGIMGKIYALKDNENIEIADAIESHYLPKFAKDNLPKSNEAAIVSLVDKIDTLVGLIAVGEIPKGNADVLGLRRAAIAVCKIIINKNYHFSMNNLLSVSLSLFNINFKIKDKEILNEVSNFIREKARKIFIDYMTSNKIHKSFMLIDSVMATGYDDLTSLKFRINALASLIKTNYNNFVNLCTISKRVCNIIKKANFSESLNPNKSVVLVNFDEIKLLEKIQEINRNFILKDNCLKFRTRQNYNDILNSFISLKPYIDNFFKNIMIMSNDKRLQEARLALLAKIKSLTLIIADFTKIKLNNT